MSLIKLNNKINIKVFYKFVKNKKGVETVKVIPEEEAKKLIDQDKTISILNTFWIPLVWGEFKKVQQNCFDVNAVSGARELNISKLRDMKLRAFLKEWDLKDENGHQLPVNEKNIDLLPLDVINYMLEEYELYVEGGEEEQKK
jgi:hypothetical protein